MNYCKLRIISSGPCRKQFHTYILSPLYKKNDYLFTDYSKENWLLHHSENVNRFTPFYQIYSISDQRVKKGQKFYNQNMKGSCNSNENMFSASGRKLPKGKKYMKMIKC